MPKALPGYSRGRPPGSSTEEKGREEEEGEEKNTKTWKIEEGILSSHKGGIARRLRMKKKKEVDKKATKWQDNGKRSNIWMT